MASCNKGRNNIVEIYQAQIVFGSYIEDGLTSWMFIQETYRKVLAKMIVKDQLLFSFVEVKGFQHFTLVICLRFRIPSRWTIVKDCYDLNVDEKKKLRTFVRSENVRVYLTF